MLKRQIWPIIVLMPGVLALSVGSLGQEPKPKKLTADEVVKLWSPQLKSASQYGQIGGSPAQSPGVGAYSFTVVGPSFEELWNHYAKLCGTEHRYEEKTFRVSSDTGPNGRYVVTDGGDGKGGRGLSTFLLKTPTYTVTITFRADTDSKTIRGSLSAVVPE